MTKIIAAFLWDQTNKAISFMLLDEQYSILVEPEKHEMNKMKMANFVRRSASLIKLFFSAIDRLKKQRPKAKIFVEYKIVHEVSHELAEFYMPSMHSDFVKKEFIENYEKLNAKHTHVKLSQQLRTRLRKPALDYFKNALREWNIVKRSRNNTYQFHLWILATHATKSNYGKILRSIERRRRIDQVA